MRSKLAAKYTSKEIA